MQPVLWGVLGNAMIARDYLIPALEGSGKAQIAGITSRGEVPADVWPKIPRYDSYESMLSDSQIEAVYIPVPNALHYEWTRKAIEAGKHVLCEKPLTVSADEAEKLLLLAKEKDVVLMEAFMYRYGGAFPKTLSLLRDGAIGALRGMNCVNGYMLDWASPAREDRALGGGVLYDIGCYIIDFMFCIARECGKSFTDGSATFQMKGGVDHHTAGWLAFEDAPASFECWFDAPGAQVFTIVGEKGVMYIDHPFEPGTSTITIEAESGQTVIEAADEGNTYRLETEAVSSLIRGEDAMRIPVEDSIGTQKILDHLLSIRPSEEENNL